MQIRNGIAEAIGNTPLIKLKRASEQTGCTILGKAEFMNPGQSVKDRAALFIIEDAVKSGRLRPGGIIVEGTAGNTGIGLALVGNALGFRSVIVIPDTQSQEKKDALRSTATTRPACSNPKAPRSLKGSDKAASPRTWKAHRSTSLIRFPTRRRWRSFSICSSTRAFASGDRRASTSPGRSGSRASLGRGTPS